MISQARLLEIAALKDEYMKAVARGDHRTASAVAATIAGCPGEPSAAWLERSQEKARRARCSVCIAPSVVICCGCSTPYCSHHADVQRCPSCGGRWLGDAGIEQFAALARIEATLAYASSDPGSLMRALDSAVELGADREQIAQASARGRRRQQTEKVLRLERAAR